MIVKDLNTDPEKVAIILLIKKIKQLTPIIGAYIEHFAYSEHDIIIKLTNGFLKVKAHLIDEVVLKNNEVSLLELEKASKTFVTIFF